MQEPFIAFLLFMLEMLIQLHDGEAQWQQQQQRWLNIKGRKEGSEMEEMSCEREEN
jgi:hypothetical protein